MAKIVWVRLLLFMRNISYSIVIEIVLSHSPRETNIAPYVLASHSEGPSSIVWQKEPLDGVLADGVSMVRSN
jgi:hypothetical protein